MKQQFFDAQNTLPDNRVVGSHGKILHVIDSLAAGGAERVLIELVNALTRRGVDVGVCVTRSNMQLATRLTDAVEVLVLNRQRTWDCGAIIKLVRYCRTRRVTILHAHGRSSVKLCAVVKMLTGNNLKLIFHDHHGETPTNFRFVAPLRLLGHSSVDFYIAVSQSLQQWALAYLRLPSHRTAVLSNAISLARFQAPPPPPPLLPACFPGDIAQPLTAVLVGNLKREKNHRLLFEALTKTHTAKKVLHVYLVGLDLHDEYSRRCRQLIVELGVEKNISLVGGRDDIPHIMRTVDFGLLCSTVESGPIALLEYMASELPFVATLTGDIAHTAHRHGLNCFVAPGDVTGYARALDELVNLTGEEKAARINRGKRILFDCFDINRQTAALINIYQGIVKSDRRVVATEQTI